MQCAPRCGTKEGRDGVAVRRAASKQHANSMMYLCFFEKDKLEGRAEKGGEETEKR